MATSRRFAPEPPPFVAHVYEDDYREIRKLVQQYPEIETGGDLFGLWQDDKTVVIQLFIGPGDKSERTTTSFHQDIDYLRRVGSVITSEEGLCNVGEWHSHHQIGMPEPSAGDRKTVFNNMPQLGLERFVLFIATIGSTRSSGQRNKRSRDVDLDQINLRCFLFVGSTHKMVSGEIQTIKGSNPHRIHNKVLREIEHGAEIPPKDSYSPGKAPKSSDVKSASQPSRNKKPDRKKHEETAQLVIGKTLKQQTEGYGASKQGQQAQGVPPKPTLSRETKPQNVKEKVTGTPRVSRETKPGELGGASPREIPPPGGNPQDDQQQRRVEEQNTVKNLSQGKGNQPRGSNNENLSPNADRGTQGNVLPSSTPQHTGSTQAWGGGPQGNFSQSTYSPSSQMSQHSRTSSHHGFAQSGTGTQRNIQSTQPGSHMSQPPYYQQPAGHASAWGQGSQGNMLRSTLLTGQTTQHSSRAAQPKPGSPFIPVTGLSRKGFF